MQVPAGRGLDAVGTRQHAPRAQHPPKLGQHLVLQAADGTWCSMVNKVAAENRPASNGSAVASACSTVTFVPASRPARERASRSSISTAVSRGT